MYILIMNLHYQLQHHHCIPWLEEQNSINVIKENLTFLNSVETCNECFCIHCCGFWNMTWYIEKVMAANEKMSQGQTFQHVIWTPEARNTLHFHEALTSYEGKHTQENSAVNQVGLEAKALCIMCSWELRSFKDCWATDNDN